MPVSSRFNGIGAHLFGCPAHEQLLEPLLHAIPLLTMHPGDQATSLVQRATSFLIGLTILPTLTSLMK